MVRRLLGLPLWLPSHNSLCSRNSLVSVQWDLKPSKEDPKALSVQRREGLSSGGLCQEYVVKGVLDMAFMCSFTQPFGQTFMLFLSTTCWALGTHSIRAMNFLGGRTELYSSAVLWMLRKIWYSRRWACRTGCCKPPCGTLGCIREGYLCWTDTSHKHEAWQAEASPCT